MSNWELSYTLSTAPANSGTLYIIDSTTLSGNVQASAAAPGPVRAHWQGKILVTGTIAVGDQDVTLYLDMLKGVAGTSADWETEVGGTVTLTANTVYPLQWRPRGVDFRARIVAGATAPNTLVTKLQIVEER